MRYAEDRFFGRRIWVYFLNGGRCIRCHSKVPSLFLKNPDVQLNRQSFKPDNSKFSFSKFCQGQAIGVIILSAQLSCEAIASRQCFRHNEV